VTSACSLWVWTSFLSQERHSRRPGRRLGAVIVRHKRIACSIPETAERALRAVDKRICGHPPTTALDVRHLAILACNAILCLLCASPRSTLFVVNPSSHLSLPVIPGCTGLPQRERTQPSANTSNPYDQRTRRLKYRQQRRGA
jgi:hypothetical protein